MNHANFIQLVNPFRPTINRKVGIAYPGTSIRRTLESKGLVKQGRLTAPFVVSINGKITVQAGWNYRIKDNDVIVVQHLPAGGQGSNPLQIVAMIALIVISYYVPGAAGLIGANAQFASAAIMIGGSMLLNMMFAQSAPGVASQTNGTASPTYTIAAQGNTARLLQPIPVLYGRQKCIPDYASAPYTEIQGSDQYLYQLFSLTQGECSIEQVLVGDSDISSYDGVQMEVVQPFAPVTLFPTNVQTSTEVASQQMYGPNSPSYTILGPFTVGDANTTTNFLAVDISIPSGLFTINDSGSIANASASYRFEYRPIDSNGNPTTPDFTLLVENTVQSASRDPIRITHKIAVPAGRYQVQGFRTNPQATDTRTSDAMFWDTLRAYLTAPTNYGNVTLVAIIMKATNQLSASASHQISIIATRKLKTWNPVDGWSATTVATTNPAWAAADILKNADYGRNLPDSTFNLQKLYTLSQTWNTRGDKFNYVFDTTQQLWTALQLCLKVGRTIPVYYAGLIEFIRNEPQAVPTAMFQPQNMTKGSFSTTYQFAEVDTPNYVTITFVNETTWLSDTVDCILPGDTPNIAATVDLPGCTNRDQAWREGITMAAQNKLQRRIINVTTELEGYLPQYNDLCQISHDVPQWGYSGRIEGLDVTSGIVTSSENFVFAQGQTHVIAFRKKNGSTDGPYTVIASPNGVLNQVQIVGKTQAQLAAIYISDGNHSEYTFYQFGPVGKAGLLAVAHSATPQGDGTVSLGFVNYDPNVFAAETGGIIPDPPPVSNLPQQPALPIIDRVTLEYTFAVGQQTIVATPANGAAYYEFQASPDGGATWIKFGTSTDPQMNVALNVGSWIIRVRGVGALAGPWTTITENVEATVLPLCTIGTLQTTSQVFGVRLDWTVSANNGGIATTVELWQGLSNDLGNAVKLVSLPTSVLTYQHSNDMQPGEVHWYFARVIDQAGRPGPWYNNGIGIQGKASDDTSLILDYLGGQIDETMLSQELQTKIDSGGGASTEITQINDKINAMILLKAQGVGAQGQPIIAGIGIGVESGASNIIMMAQTFSIQDNTNNASQKYPFIVTGGVVYMNTAFIQDATISFAKIVNNIQSSYVNGDGQPAWILDKGGAMNMYGTGSYGSTKMQLDSIALRIYNAGVERVTLGSL